MTKILFLSFCLFLNSTFGQPTQVLNDIQKSVDDAADIYISRLTCNSAIVTPTYFERLVLDSSGESLVALNNKNLNRKLVSHIDDTSKVLAIHVILTRRLEYDKGFGVEYVYDSIYKHIVRVNFSCNNFTWYYLLNDDNPECFFHIDKSEFDKIKLYWIEKLKT